MMGCFFSGKVDGARSDQEANSGRSDEEVLEESDLIVVCQKYTTGWDEWRIVAVLGRFNRRKTFNSLDPYRVVLARGYVTKNLLTFSVSCFFSFLLTINFLENWLLVVFSNY